MVHRVLPAIAFALATPLTGQQTFHEAAAPPPPPGTLFIYPERYAPRVGQLADGERAMLFVPVNRADTSRGVIGIELWRFRAASPGSLPPVFLLHGGPGFDGLNPPDSAYHEGVIRRFTAYADLVVVGQRGIGTSKPNTICENVRGPSYYTACRGYWESRGLDLSGLNVIEAAGDVADAARALGYDSIIVFGTSFGSHWGMAVLRYHPELVARAVLSGMEGPNHTYDSPTGVWNALRHVAEAAERSEQLRPLVPDGGLVAGLHATRAELEDGPVRVTVHDSATGRDETMVFSLASFPGLVDGYSASPSGRDGLASWPADILRLVHRDFAGIARARLARAAGSARGGEGFQTASFFMLDCGSGITASRLAELKADVAIPMVGDKTSFYESACRAWNANLGDAFRRNFETEVPTAIVQGTWDVNTPYENALELAPHFRRGKLVSVVGGSHGALREAMDLDTAFAGALWTFVRTGNMRMLPDSVVLPPMEWIVPDDVRALVTGNSTQQGSEGSP